MPSNQPIKVLVSLSVIIFFFMSCSKDSSEDENNELPDPESTELYFPPVGSNTWETNDPQDLNWNVDQITPLYDFLEENNSDAFIILKDGKIVLERYFRDFNSTKNHSWNSAAKTLTSMTVGIAQSEGFLSLDQSSALYLGNGWSAMTEAQENNITIWHHLTMTTGLDYTVANNFCTDPACFLYKNEPGTYWYYHQGAYTLLDEIITNATGSDFKDYFNTKIRDKIGMQGIWTKVGYNNLYFSTARSMARYGLLNLNNGVWEDTVVFSDPDYFTNATNTSQNLNPAYGYLYWLNGKDTFKVPSFEENFSGKLIANAPDDLYAGLGAFDQKLYIVPSKNLVIIRFGDAANSTELGPSSFDNALWDKINAVIN